MKLLASGTGNQQKNKDKAMTLYLALYPDSLKASKNRIMHNDRLLNVAAATDPVAAMVTGTKPDELERIRSGKVSPWMEEVQGYVIVRQTDDGIKIYTITDFATLISYRGEGKGVAGSSVAWENIAKCSDDIINII